MRLLPCWSVRGISCRKTRSHLKSRWPPRARKSFTTHTAVAAGFDRFTPALIEQYLGCYATEKTWHTLHDLLALGRQNPNDATESFNMAYLRIRGSGSVNGVSRLHGQVSRHLFEPLFPHWRQTNAVGHVTNGIQCRRGTRRTPTNFGQKPVARTAGWERRKLWSRTFAASPITPFGNFALRPPSVWLVNMPRASGPALRRRRLRRRRRLNRQNIS